ncbi:hypothetical protein RN001_009219 [Aquatica leii]|uniref:Purine nucleoside phosphorylase n=1 Tax=Aquatica leii TaxID=1421715 RepID=A0AAN7P6B9_9COLE|nr:hypothetical protein RN001_009219 [Aquatica leii]
MNHDDYNSNLYESTKYLLDNVKIKPKIGIICGTGLGFLTDEIQEQIIFPYQSIPHFPVSTTKGHLGNLIFGYIAGVPVMCLQGRFHFFEGYSPQECVLPIRMMKLLGITHVLISNSAGALNPKFQIGNIMLIKDHINMLGIAGFNPLCGPNLDSLGPRFPCMNEAYCTQLIKYARKVAEEENFSNNICEGVYGCVSGPNYETAAEVKMLRMVGIDAVGMSTAHEVLTAKHCNMTVFAFSIITNICISNYDDKKHPDHEVINSIAETKKHALRKLVTKIVQRMDESR